METFWELAVLVLTEVIRVLVKAAAVVEAHKEHSEVMKIVEE